ncbi:MAG: hypothetical protein DI498_09435 [Paracoccus denitrificans]|nr:MAG: hypothetical protein DI498_09435 [Paracoccus denitrificans]PZO84090.1 MAG: hypothetical protein DI633_09435 [Paracoccus denitrificans]
MTPSSYIDLLLKKYRQAPQFPFDDWAESPVSFYALINLWDEVFRAAAGERASDYVAMQDVSMDEFSPLYDVVTAGRDRHVTIRHACEGGGVLLVSKKGDTNFRPEDIPVGALPDRSWLDVSCDLNQDRLCAVFEMIRDYVRTPLPELGMAEELERRFIIRHRTAFRTEQDDPFENYDENGRYVERPHEDTDEA